MIEIVPVRAIVRAFLHCRVAQLVEHLTQETSSYQIQRSKGRWFESTHGNKD